jgi:hypothetical protein
VDTVEVTDAAELANVATNDDNLDMIQSQYEELWDIWYTTCEEFGDCKLITIPDWLAKDSFGERRPILVGNIEHDDEEKGAVLFRNLRKINISIVENRALTEVTGIEPEDLAEPVDISDDNDYVEEAGLSWIPRSEMCVYERND